uniref:PH domain-containing protein n=1 Tax=Acrobeloides nanus TaxID=290746 RepID=A0A914CSN8_9BILA
MYSQIGKNHSGSPTNPAILELTSENKLGFLRQRGDVLFNGKLCSEKDGGFNQLTHLPPEPVIKLLNSDLEFESFAVYVSSRGWIVNRTSRWRECRCYFSKSQGVLFVYFNRNNRGYALKLSHAKQMQYTMFKNEMSKSIAAVDHCLIKFKWEFGALKIYLNKNQIRKWQPLLSGAFNSLAQFTSYAKHFQKFGMESLPTTSSTQSLRSDSSSTYSIKYPNAKFPTTIDKTEFLYSSDEHSLSNDFTNTPSTVEELMEASKNVVLLNRRSHATPSKKPETSFQDLAPKHTPRPRTVAEKIDFYRNLSRRPDNENYVKHSITMRNPGW